MELVSRLEEDQGRNNLTREVLTELSCVSCPSHNDVSVMWTQRIQSIELHFICRQRQKSPAPSLCTLICVQTKKGNVHLNNAKLCPSISATSGDTRTLRSPLSTWDKSSKCSDFSEQMSRVSQHQLHYSATVNSRKD